MIDVVATLDPEGKAETAASVSKKVSTAVWEVESNVGGVMLIVSSGAILKLLLNDWAKVPVLDNCSVTIVRYEAGTYQVLEHCNLVKIKQKYF